jgi:hypothetical protein
MSKGTGICDTGRHLIGLESPTYFRGKYQERVRSQNKIPTQIRISFDMQVNTNDEAGSLIWGKHPVIYGSVVATLYGVFIIKGFTMAVHKGEIAQAELVVPEARPNICALLAKCIGA